MTRDEMTRDLKRLGYYASCIELLFKSQITNQYISSMDTSSRCKLEYLNNNLEDCIQKYTNILFKYLDYILKIKDPIYQSLLLGKYVVGVRNKELLKNYRQDTEYLQYELKSARNHLYTIMCQE